MIQHYVSIVSRLPFVQEVQAEAGLEGVGVWTVIDAEPFAIGPRRKVYKAELQAAQACPDAYVSFRLLNRLEYGDEKLRQVLPEDGHSVWQRSTQP
jgi:hypothetical protein